MRNLKLITIQLAAATAAALTFTSIGAASAGGPAGPVCAIKGARIRHRVRRTNRRRHHRHAQRRHRDAGANVNVLPTPS